MPAPATSPRKPHPRPCPPQRPCSWPVCSLGNTCTPSSSLCVGRLHGTLAERDHVPAPPSPPQPTAQVGKLRHREAWTHWAPGVPHPCLPTKTSHITHSYPAGPLGCDHRQRGEVSAVVLEGSKESTALQGLEGLLEIAGGGAGSLPGWEWADLSRTPSGRPGRDPPSCKGWLGPVPCSAQGLLGSLPAWGCPCLLAGRALFLMPQEGARGGGLIVLDALDSTLAPAMCPHSWH